MAGEVILVEALHDENDAAALLVVETAIERVVVPLIDRAPLALRGGFIGLHGIIDDDDIGAPAGERTPDRGREPIALSGRHIFPYRLLAGREARREETLVPRRAHD